MDRNFLKVILWLLLSLPVLVAGFWAFCRMNIDFLSAQRFKKQKRIENEKKEQRYE